MLLLEEFEKYVAQNELFGHDDKILLTVSGGVDSMVMMSLFAASGYRFGVAHCNFQLRGQESDEDEALVAEQARRYGVELFNRRFDTQGDLELLGEYLDLAAVRLLKTWFGYVCDDYVYNVIAIAHHINDSIETFFINMLRGTGLRGLTGISVQAGRIVRPLMFATRKDILDYATAHRIPYREDSSNRSTKYLRNKVRLGIVPMLREINPQFTTVMRRNISRLTDAQTFIDRSVELIRRDAMTEQGGLYTLHVDRIDASLPLGYVVYEILNSMFGFKGDTVDALCHALQQNNTGRRFYSREWVATIDRGRIVIGRIADEDTCMTQVEQGVLRSYCGSSVLHYEYCDIDMIDSVTTPDNVALVDADKLRFPLTLRRWQQGDWFVPFGMSGRKKVSDFLIDAKVSMAEKSRQFVLLSGDDVVWVVGRRADDRFRLTRQTENVLKITREIL